MKLLAGCLILALNVGLSAGTMAPLLRKVLCPRNSPNMSECYLRAVLALAPQVFTGDYGDGITAPSLDPFLFSLNVSQPDGFQLTVTDGYITNFKNMQITRLRVSMTEAIVCITMKLPGLEIDGEYTLKMNLGDLLRIDGAGIFHVADDPTLKIVYSIIKDEYNRYPIKAKLIFDHPTLTLTGVFAGNPAMDAFANTLINQNPLLILDALTPALEDQIQNTCGTISTILVGNATFDELFPATINTIVNISDYYNPY